MRRVCFHLQVRPDRLAEYRDRHQQVWPEMRAALRASGWHNYSLFLAEDGRLTGYLECDDFDEAQARMAVTDVNARWQAEMEDFFEALDGHRPDEQMAPLEEIFHLD